ncbi:MAG: uncharacterized protein PWP48_192 [Clostridiales bacterium]|jgi:hypothetical protein|nr:uncharacterized protein [Clostridiales bacterium]MDK2990959.1 uncharacterized protein [Clostridiales bacterium]
MMRKIPERTCVACRQAKPKKELIRVVRNNEGNVCIDPTGKAAGRGAYICANIQCISKAHKSRALDRALKVKVEDSVYEDLERYSDTEVVADGKK